MDGAFGGDISSNGSAAAKDRLGKETWFTVARSHTRRQIRRESWVRPAVPLGSRYVHVHAPILHPEAYS